jgi:hypothetical protein
VPPGHDRGLVCDRAGGDEGRWPAHACSMRRRAGPRRPRRLAMSAPGWPGLGGGRWVDGWRHARRGERRLGEGRPT